MLWRQIKHAYLSPVGIDRTHNDCERCKRSDQRRNGKGTRERNAPWQAEQVSFIIQRLACIGRGLQAEKRKFNMVQRWRKQTYRWKGLFTDKRRLFRCGDTQACVWQRYLQRDQQLGKRQYRRYDKQYTWQHSGRSNYVSCKCCQLWRGMGYHLSRKWYSGRKIHKLRRQAYESHYVVLRWKYLSGRWGL